jgi:hypothetical protein
MADPFFEIDIPRLERSIVAAQKRAPLRRGASAKADQVGWLFAFLGNGNVSREEKSAMRKAAHILIKLLDKSQCPRTHCKDWSSQFPCNCLAGKNPKRCPELKSYIAKKHANHPECKGCKSRSGKYSDGQYWCQVKRNADRPEGCPKVKKESGE